MGKADEVLAQAFGPQHWAIEKPQDGKQKECYIAAEDGRKVFIKFDVPIASLQRLSDLGVAPHVLASGIYQGVNYVIQEFLTGTYPNRSWLTVHIADIASLIRTYHEDRQLAAILDGGNSLSYRQHLEHDLDDLGMRLAQQPAEQDLQSAFRQFRALATTFDDTPLVPVHNEPNTKNMLVHDGMLTFIDWDEVLLSDPVRDIGTFLWWYLPVERWQDFFHAYGALLTPGTEAKIYWFAARASLVIYLWHREHGDLGTSFHDDFLAALNRQPNPHAASTDLMGL